MWSIWQALAHLEQRVRRLEAENAELRRELQQAPKNFRVKKLVYHIHALHIKEMSGTLNIGVTAPIDESEMERLVLDMKTEHD